MANTDLELEQLKLGELDKKLWLERHNFSENELENKLADLKASDQEILSMYPTEKMKEIIFAKMNKNCFANDDILGTVGIASEFDTSKRPLKMPFLRLNKSIASLAAAFILCAILIPLQMTKKVGTADIANTTNVTSEKSSQIRLKGVSDASIFLYKNENGNVVKLADHSKLKDGDVVQISYVAGNKTQGMIFSIDGNGVLTQHYPEKKAQSDILQQGKEVALDFSYKLDDAPRFEKFYFVTSTESFSSDDLVISLDDGTVSSANNKKLSVVEFYLEK